MKFYLTIGKVVKGDTTLYRLTDIKTEEVSMVDRAANKRKWIVTKNNGARTTMKVIDKSGETDMTKIAKSGSISTETVVEVLASLTKSLEQLATVTDSVKTFTEASAEAVEKGVETIVPVDAWGASLTEISKSIAELFSICPALSAEEEKTETTPPSKTEEEIAAEKAATEKAAADKAEADKKVAEEAAVKAAEVEKAQKKEKFETFRKSITEIAKEMSALTTPTAEGLTAVTKKLENVYISGGLMIDTYDIGSLEKVCSALRAVVNDGSDATDTAKNAELTMSEAIERIGKVAKRLETAESATDREGKDLKIVELLVKSVSKDLGVVVQTPAAKTETPEELEKKIAAIVEAAVTKASEGFKKTIDELTTKKTELETKLAKSMSSETQTRGSSGETTSVEKQDESKLFPLDYNAEKHGN